MGAPSRRVVRMAIGGRPTTRKPAPSLPPTRPRSPKRHRRNALGTIDAHGSVVLGAMQMLIDERLPKMGDEALFRQLSRSASMRFGMRLSRARAFGNIVGAPGCTHILRRYAGPHVIASGKLHIDCAFRIGRNTGMRTRSRSKTGFSLRRGTRNAAR